jgi:hypothetical protein
MNHATLACALALGFALTPAAAMADDPNDPAMRAADARARDRAIIRQLNRNQLAKVQARDAGYAAGWRAYREGGARNAGDARAENARRRADYDRQMAAWRRAVAACNAGSWEYCDR